jgi:hypothetical protein
MNVKGLSVLRSVTAVLCIFTTISATASSSTLASQAISQAVSLGNSQLTGTTPTSAQVTTLAATLNSYISAADKDGSLAAAQALILSNLPGSSTQLAQAAFVSLQAHGWQGTQSQVSSWMSQVSPAQRTAISQQVQAQGLKAYLLTGVTILQQVATLIASNEGHSKLVYANYNYDGARLFRALTSDQCNTFTGAFLAITAIGAGAALGGVDPLGDLLAAIGAFGLLYVWFACS